MIARRAPILALVALFVAALASFASVTAVPATAATPGLTITSDTRYVVDPAHKRVHVSVWLVAVNHLKDTKTREYYFDRAFLAVQPGTTGFKISARTGSPTVRVVSKRKDHNLIRIDFGKRLPAGATRTFSLTFDIPDPGGAPTRDVRIGASLVTFSAWAFATESTPGGTVGVTFPAGYTIEVRSDRLGEPTTDAAGNVTYLSGRLGSPLTFFAYFVADRSNAYAETSRTVEVDGRPLDISVRAWPDDPAWAERIGTTLERGVPALSQAIGLPWIGQRPLVVAEAISRSTAGFSGRYDPVTGRIEIAYYASPFVALHEAAHAWFDGRLLADRWATEGFASWYALQAAASVGLKATEPQLTKEQLAQPIPLNAWGPVGSDVSAAEDYGYLASAELARLVAERAGPAALAGVWHAARDGIGAYQPLPADPRGPDALPSDRGPAAMAAIAGAREADAPPPDWRGLLDLLEERTGKSFEDLWRAWVVRPSEESLLDSRAIARERYAAVVARAGDWQLPALIRQAMRSWQFDQATELLAAADRTLDDRDAVATAARDAGLKVPSQLQETFEQVGGFAAAGAEADAELAAIAAYDDASLARLADPDVIEQIGMWGLTPNSDLSNAARAFALGALGESVQASNAARLTWEGAREIGRNRAMSILAAALAALIGVGFVVSQIRGRAARLSMRRAERRARRSGIAQAHVATGDARAGATGRDR
jgi:hypothetical protein